MSNNYLDNLMMNYPSSTDSLSYSPSSPMIGGVLDVPNGGFPPITICTSKPGKEENKTEEKAKREYVTHKTAVSIKNILEKRRHVTPLTKTD